MYVFKNKKGFTLVELVIVIAVVAILAAVLIPTFSNIVKKANMTADQMAVKNMNTVLSLEDNVNNDRIVALEILEKGGFNTENLIPTTANHRFYWNSTYNMVLLVDCTNQDNLIVVFPQNIPDVIEDFNNNYYLSYDLSNLLPRATLTPLDNLTVVSNLGEETLDVGIALSTTENEASVEFANWEADFTISFNRDLEFSENFNDDKTLADSNKVALFLGGQYDDFGEDWLAFPATAAEVYSISANEEIRVIGTVLDGSGIPYNFICDNVNTFNCGIKIIPGEDIILSGLVVTLKLKLYEPDNGQEERKSYVISTFRYTYK